jgi:hypothetical protein
VRVQSLIGRDAGQEINVPYHVARSLLDRGHAAAIGEVIMDRMKVKHHVGPLAGTTEDLPRHAAEALIVTGQASLVPPDPAAPDGAGVGTEVNAAGGPQQAEVSESAPESPPASSGDAPAKDFDAMTAEELHKEAAEREIAGRSDMNKDDLLKAVKKHEKAQAKKSRRKE